MGTIQGLLLPSLVQIGQVVSEKKNYLFNVILLNRPIIGQKKQTTLNICKRSNINQLLAFLI
jgi:hypothetical protein